MNINIAALKGVIEEVEASKVRQKAEGDLQREAIKRAAKNHQLDAKAIRIVLQRRAMSESKRDEQDYFVHAYELALGGKKAAQEAIERGASVREAAKAGGISTGAAGNIARAVQESRKLDAHDPDTGEITEQNAAPRSVSPAEASPQPAPEGGEGAGTHSDREVDTLGVDVGRRSEPSEPAEQSVKSAPPPERASLGIGNGQGTQADDLSNRESALQRMADLGQEIDADDLAIPEFLDRRRQREARA